MLTLLIPILLFHLLPLSLTLPSPSPDPAANDIPIDNDTVLPCTGFNSQYILKFPHRPDAQVLPTGVPLLIRDFCNQLKDKPASLADHEELSRGRMTVSLGAKPFEPYPPGGAEAVKRDRDWVCG